MRSGANHERATGALWYFCLLQIGYLVPVIALLTWGENARYRYIIEPFIWLIVTGTLFDWGRVHLEPGDGAIRKSKPGRTIPLTSGSSTVSSPVEGPVSN
jgi:hypothetical protein